jgi:hypothetical protein
MLPLKYLFEAEFTDGTIYTQTADDVSNIDPKRSQFYDVLHTGKTIKRFSLVGEGNKLTVDLTTGFFEVNGLTVLLESTKLPGPPDKFDLVFYRQRTHDIDVTYEKKTGNVVETGGETEFCEYFIGWTCEIAGKHYIQKMAVA